MYAFVILCLSMLSLTLTSCAQAGRHFDVIAFYTAERDPAHVSFVKEANKWLAIKASEHNFTYDTTSSWNNLNGKFLSKYDVVIFLDTRPEDADQRSAFREYMENGGAWIGFHFAAFALKDSDYPDNWEWYSDEFLGCGEYKSNTWRPTAESLRVESHSHPTCKDLPAVFLSAPNEWYRWEKDLRANNDILILLSLDQTTFPVGTGPKAHEIWYSGDYPVAWTNKKFRMIYINTGHNDMDYEGGTNRQLSETFSSENQSRFILQSLLWLGGR